MNEFSRMVQQLRSLWQSLSVVPRLVVLLVPLAVVAGLAWHTAGGSSHDPWVKLEQGFSHDKLQQVVESFRAAGLEDHVVEDGALFVRASRVKDYVETFRKSSVTGPDWTQAWERQVGQLGAFPTTTQYEQARELALRKDIRQMLLAVSEITDAKVLLARPRSRQRFRDKHRRVTATISVQLRSEARLTRQQAATLRAAVAGGVPDLAVEDVVIFDQSSMTVYTEADAVQGDAGWWSGEVRRIGRERTAAADPAADVVPSTVTRGQTPNTTVDTVPSTAAETVDDSAADPAADTGPADDLKAFGGIFVAVVIGLLLVVALRSRVTRSDNMPEPDDWFSPPSKHELDDTDSGFVVSEEQGGEELPERESEEPVLSTPDGSERVLDFLVDIEPEMLAGWLAEEHCQAAAIVLSQLTEEQREDVLEYLPATLREEVRQRVVEPQVPHPDVLDDLAETLRDRWRLEISELPSTGSDTSRLSGSEVRLLHAVEGVLKEFEDLQGLDESLVKELVELVGIEQWSVALTGASHEVRQRVLGGLAPQEARRLASEVDYLGPVRLGEIGQAQREILKLARRLAVTADGRFAGEDA